MGPDIIGSLLFALYLFFCFISICGFVFGVYACIKVTAFERSTHTIEFQDAQQAIHESQNGYDFEPDVDKINDDIRDDDFQKEMDNELNPNNVVI